MFFKKFRTGFKFKNEFQSLLKNKKIELKNRENFDAEIKKETIDLSYENDTANTNNLKRKIDFVDKIAKGTKSIDKAFIDYVTQQCQTKNKTEIVILSNILSNASRRILNYKIANDATSKSLESLRDFSEYDPVVIQTRIEEALVKFQSSNNFTEIRDNLIENIAKAELVKSNHVYVKGLLALDSIYSQTNQIVKSEYIKSRIRKIAKVVSNDQSLYGDIVLSVYTRSETELMKKINNFEEESKLFFTADFLITDYNYDSNNPQLIFKRLERINRILDQVNKIDSNSPTVIGLLVKKWILTHILGRQATATYSLDLAKRLIQSNSLYDDSFYLHFYRMVISEAMFAGMSADVVDSFYNSMPAPTKIGSDMIYYRALGLNISMAKRENKDTIMMKYNELKRMSEVYYGDQENAQEIESQMKIEGYI